MSETDRKIRDTKRWQTGEVKASIFLTYSIKKQNQSHNNERITMDE